MKTILFSLAAFLGLAVCLPADEKTTTTTTTKTVTSTGTISEYTPGTTFVVKEEKGPVTYKYGKKIVYVTKGGKELSEEDVKTRIKVGIPVTVHYDSDGDARIVNRVVIDD